jgi:hypothetical protein
MEGDLVRALQLIQELSDHIVLNQKMAASLQSQAVTLKVGMVTLLRLRADEISRTKQRM